MRPSVPLILAVLLCSAALTGCGLKDDLFLPSEPPPQINQDEQGDDEESSRT
jgi:predicted small lipoprotein YifL